MNTLPVNREALSASSWVLQDGKRSPFKPEIYFLTWQNKALCIKDFSNCNGLVRNTLGRWTVNKEAYVLAALAEVSGVPDFIGVIAGPALVMTCIDGKALPKPKPMPITMTPSLDNALTPAFFNKTSALLTTLHGEGVTHGDIHRANLLIDNTGQPSFIDFASALVKTGKQSRLKHWAWQTMAKIDLISILNLRQKYFPDHPLSQEETSLLATQPRAYRLHNKLRISYIRPIKRVFRAGFKVR